MFVCVYTRVRTRVLHAHIIGLGRGQDILHLFRCVTRLFHVIVPPTVCAITPSCLISLSPPPPPLFLPSVAVALHFERAPFFVYFFLPTGFPLRAPSSMGNIKMCEQHGCLNTCSPEERLFRDELLSFHAAILLGSLKTKH